MTALLWSGLFSVSRPGSFLHRSLRMAGAMILFGLAVVSLLMLSCASAAPLPERGPAQTQTRADSLRLAVDDARSAAEEAEADSLFPDLYTSVQAEYNAGMDAEESGATESAAAIYRTCLSLYATLARLADARSLCDELSNSRPELLGSQAGLEAGVDLETAIEAFWVDEQQASRGAAAALAEYSALAAGARP
ncbi:MAG TPA: hypothetical protein VMC79_00380 [Rectinemataceae bacterium]|nr:hypothetical protein [Rectinemataceae bacterium]